MPRTLGRAFRKPETLAKRVEAGKLIPADEKRWFLKKKIEHGRYIFAFRNIQTNQVLYSFYPGLDQRHIRQLPFIGKHSVPPNIRTDIWKPFCTVSFPSAAQGLHAFRKLREFRKLHELRWDYHNPEWKKLKVEAPKKLIRNIMNQRANSVADIAQVLLLQREQGIKMVKETEKRTELQNVYLDEKWAELKKLARLAEDGELQTLEDEIKARTKQLKKAKGNEEEQKRLNATITIQQRRMKKLLWAQQMVRLRDEASGVALDQTPAETEEVVASGMKSSEQSSRETIKRSLLPKSLKSHPEPFTLEGIEIQWADLQDPECAEQWPTEIVHDFMGSLQRDPPIPGRETRRFPVTEDEWDAEQAELLEQARVRRYPERQTEKAAEVPQSSMDRIRDRLRVFPNLFKRAQTA